MLPAPQQPLPAEQNETLQVNRRDAQRLHIAELQLPQVVTEVERSLVGMLAPRNSPARQQCLPIKLLVERLAVGDAEVVGALLSATLPAMCERIIESNGLSTIPRDERGNLAHFSDSDVLALTIQRLHGLSGQHSPDWSIVPLRLILLVSLRALRGLDRPDDTYIGSGAWETIGCSILSDLSPSDVDDVAKRGIIGHHEHNSLFTTASVVPFQEHLIANASLGVRLELWRHISETYGCPLVSPDPREWIASRMQSDRYPSLFDDQANGSALPESTITGLVLRAHELTKPQSVIGLDNPSDTRFRLPEFHHPMLLTPSVEVCLRPEVQHRTRIFLDNEWTYNRYFAEFESVTTSILCERVVAERNKDDRRLSWNELPFITQRPPRIQCFEEMEADRLRYPNDKVPDYTKVAAIARYLETRVDCRTEWLQAIQAVVVREAIFDDQNRIFRYANLVNVQTVPSLSPHELSCIHPMERAATINRTIFAAYDSLRPLDGMPVNPDKFNSPAASETLELLASDLPMHFRAIVVDYCLHMLVRTFQDDRRFRGTLLEKADRDIVKELRSPGALHEQEYIGHLERKRARGEALRLILDVLAKIVSEAGDRQWASTVSDQLNRLNGKFKNAKCDVHVKKGDFDFYLSSVSYLLCRAIYRISPDFPRYRTN